MAVEGTEFGHDIIWLGAFKNQDLVHFIISFFAALHTLSLVHMHNYVDRRVNCTIDTTLHRNREPYLYISKYAMHRHRTARKSRRVFYASHLRQILLQTSQTIKSTKPHELMSMSVFWVVKTCGLVRTYRQVYTLLQATRPTSTSSQP